MAAPTMSRDEFFDLFVELVLLSEEGWISIDELVRETGLTPQAIRSRLYTFPDIINKANGCQSARYGLPDDWP